MPPLSSPPSRRSPNVPEGRVGTSYGSAAVERQSQGGGGAFSTFKTGLRKRRVLGGGCFL